MTARTYDLILKVSPIADFKSGSVIVGNTSATVATVAAVDSANNILKVKLANLQQEFISTESIHSNTITLTGTANGALNSTSLPFQANVMSGNVTIAKGKISSIAPSNFIAEKNAFTQNPIVRLYTIYYPGEWYPPNENGNPTGMGEGRAWPNDFPLHFAEIVGDMAHDIMYNVTFDGISYIPFPLNMTGMSQSSDGKINELTLSVFNTDNMISVLVEDPYLTGNNISNSVIAYVNGEPVHGIDPRTVAASPEDVGTTTSKQYKLLKQARTSGLIYDPAMEAYYGRANATFNKTTTEQVNGKWVRQKLDTRDLLGGVVEVKTTFANFLDYWPEYGLTTIINNNEVHLTSTLPYRVGDQVTVPNTNIGVYNITSVTDEKVVLTNSTMYADTPIQPLPSMWFGDFTNAKYATATPTDTIPVSSPLYIINADADSDSYLEDKYKIDQLESLSDYVATFGLVSWLQHFKIVTPKRKYYKNTCQWLYKGAECQYPGPGGKSIPGTKLKSNTNPIAADNTIADDLSGDSCSKSYKACTLRNNAIHFGGFPGVGRTVPRA